MGKYTKRTVSRRKPPKPMMEFLPALFEQDTAAFGARPLLECWVNDRYQVLVFDAFRPPGWPKMVHLSIKRLDKEPIHDWRDLQRIKNELCGTEAEGVELYPAEDRLVDEANQYHMWVVEPGQRFPFGHFSGRAVSGESGTDPATGKPWRQRPIDDHHTADGCSRGGKITWAAVPEVPDEEHEPTDTRSAARDTDAALSAREG